MTDERCDECDVCLSGEKPDKHKEECSHAPKCDSCGLWLEHDEYDFEYSYKFPCGHKEDCPNRPKCELCGVPLGGRIVSHRTSCAWTTHSSAGYKDYPTATPPFEVHIESAFGPSLPTRK